MLLAFVNKTRDVVVFATYDYDLSDDIEFVLEELLNDHK